MAAIYQWFNTDEFVIATTTLYPIEDVECLNWGATVIHAGMYTWPDDDMDLVYSVVGVALTTVLIEGATESDEMDLSYGIGGVDLNEILLIGPTPIDEMNFAYGIVGVDLNETLVEAQAPPDGLEWGCTVVAATFITL